MTTDLQRLYNDLSRYQAFKSDANSIVASLKSAIEPIGYAIDKLAENYKYDDYAADNAELNTEKDRIKNIINSLERSIIPEINRNIEQLRIQIQDAEVASALSANNTML